MTRLDAVMAEACISTVWRRGLSVLIEDIACDEILKC